MFGDIAAGEAPIIGLPGTVVNGTTSVSQSTGMVTFTSNQPAANGDGQFGITLTDSFGETSSVATVTVPVNPSGGPDTNPDNCQVTFAVTTDYNLGFDVTTCPEPTANDFSAFLPLTVVSVGVPNTTGSTASVSNGTVTYRPASFFFNGLTVTSSSDNFTYNVADAVPLQSTDTITMDVNAAIAFSTDLDADPAVENSIVNQLNGCTGCHTSVGRVDLSVYSNTLNRVSSSGTLDISRNATTTESELLGASIYYACRSSHGSFTSAGNLLCGSDSTQDVIPTSRADLNATGQAVLDWTLSGAPNN